jgi:hypothetical protein
VIGNACGSENRAGVKFCEACAAPLPRACASCGAELQPNAKFCGACAAPTASAEASTSGRSCRSSSPTPRVGSRAPGGSTTTAKPKHAKRRRVRPNGATTAHDRLVATFVARDLAAADALLGDGLAAIDHRWQISYERDRRSSASEPSAIAAAASAPGSGTVVTFVDVT